MTLPFVYSGLQLVKNFSETGRLFSSGIKRLDDLLDGGINTGQVVEVIGQSRTGKTHLCHVMAARVAGAHKPSMGHNVLYLDCACQFSVARLLFHAEKECLPEKEAGDKEEHHVAKTLSRVSVIRGVNLEEILTIFEELLAKVKHARKKTGKLDISLSTPATFSSTKLPTIEKAPELIIIDSLSSAFSMMPFSTLLAKNTEKDTVKSCFDENEIKANRKRVEQLIAKFSLLIRQVAYFANLAIVVTNPVPVPQLLFSGSYYNAWTSAPHIRLFLDFPSSDSAFYSRENLAGRQSDRDLNRQRIAKLRYHCSSLLNLKTHSSCSANGEGELSTSFTVY